MKSRLYIAAKPPRPRVAKTRLGVRIGHEHAARLYRAFLQDLAARFASFPHPVGWFVPPDSWPEIREVVGGGWDGVVLQRGGDWTERQRGLFQHASSRGEERTVLMASDSPHLSNRVVEEAFALLDKADVVLGPVQDGGYYLLGIRGGHDVLEGVEMSNSGVNAAIDLRCRELGLNLALLEPTFDVDEAEDLELLRPLAQCRPDLAATRAALA